MTNLEIYKVIRSVVIAVTGVPTVIRSNPNAPSPSGDYCAISVSQPVRQRGQANITKSNVNQTGGWVGVTHDVKPQLIVDASLNFYRGSAHEYARKVFQANKRPDIQELLFKNKIGWNGSQPVNNLNAIQSENWENRAQVTVRLMFEDTTTIDTNAIYKVGVIVEDESGNELENIEIDTPTP